jgi:hypothetical protein
MWPMQTLVPYDPSAERCPVPTGDATYRAVAGSANYARAPGARVGARYRQRQPVEVSEILLRSYAIVAAARPQKVMIR